MQPIIGTLYIVSAPSGAGKTSLLREVVPGIPDLLISVSHTTRSARPGEQDGINYFFVDKARFEELVEAGDFLEHAEVFGNHYGTSRSKVTAMLEQGKDVILEIDWQGARRVRELFPDAVSIFILPPDRESLQERLHNRRQDSDEVIYQRMCQACNEMSHYHEYDYLIINDDFAQAASQLSAIFIAERMRLARQQRQHEDLLAELVSSEQGAG